MGANRGGNVSFTAGAGNVGGRIDFIADDDGALINFESTGTGNTIQLSAPAVVPNGSGGSLGSVADPWDTFYVNHVIASDSSSFANGLAVTNTLVLDGDLEMTGNATIRSVQYIWPVSQGDAGSRLENDGTGVLTWSTNGSGFTGIYRDQSIEAGAMFPGPTAATFGQLTNTVNDTMSDSFIFADGVTQSTRFALTLPDTWTGASTVKLKLYVTCDSTNSAAGTNLVWGVKAGSLAPGEALTNAVFGTEVFVTNGLNTAGQVMQMFLTPAITVGGSPAMGDSLWFNIARQGANASDTWTNTPVRLLKARCQWLEAAAPSSW